jgi:hypothetical protein
MTISRFAAIRVAERNAGYLSFGKCEGSRSHSPAAPVTQRTVGQR